MWMSGSTLKEVRDFVQQELRTQQLQQPVGRPSSGGSNRQSRRTSRSNGISALLPTDRFAPSLWSPIHNSIGLVVDGQRKPNMALKVEVLIGPISSIFLFQILGDSHEVPAWEAMSYDLFYGALMFYEVA